MYQDKFHFLEEILGKGRYNSSSNEAIFFCPFCNHRKQKLYINLELDRFNCYVCSKGGYNLFPIISLKGTSQDLNLYNSKYRVKKQEQKEKVIETFERINLPEEYVPLCTNDSYQADKAINYLVNRGLTEEDIVRYKIGTCIDGRYNGMVIFPSFNKRGDVNYFTARSTTGNIKLIPPTERGYKKTIIVNELNINFSEPLLIVEGFIDAIKSGINNVSPLMGSYFSEEYELFKQIASNNTIVYLSLDADAAEKSSKIIKMLAKYTIVVYNVGIGTYKDIGQMEKGVFQTYYDKATLMNGKSIFEYRLNNIKMESKW